MDSMPMPPDVDRLLANAGWVKALAVRLVADEAAADDLAQETWLRALERPPRAADTARSLRAWLARVVGRFALQRRRHDEAAERRERAVAAAEAQPDVADVVAHAELHRRIVDAVLALDEPYRAMLLLRFFEDETPARIAARMGVPPKTVHTRLRRGLERLRALRSNAVRAAAPRDRLGAPPRGDLPRRHRQSLCSRSAGSPGGSQVAECRRSAVAGSFNRLARWRDPERAPRSAAPAESAGRRRAARDPPLHTRPAAPRRLEPGAPPRAHRRDGQIVFQERCPATRRINRRQDRPLKAPVSSAAARRSTRIDGVEHVVDEELRAHGFWDAPCAPPRTSAASDDDGRFEIRGLRTGMPYALTVAKDGYRAETRSVPPDRYGDAMLGACTEVRLHDVVLAHGGGLVVHVVDAHGADVGGAAVYSGEWSGRELLLWPGNRRGATDRIGRLTFAPVRSGRIWIAARASDGREASSSTRRSTNRRRRLRIPTATAEQPRVRDRDGRDRRTARHIRSHRHERSDDRPRQHVDDAGRVEFTTPPAVRHLR
jgi:RNA polymerase sigma-70 factor (ECF subfamily)